MGGLIYCVLVGLAAGWIAKSTMGGGGGWWMLGVGVAGSFIGPIIIRLLGFKQFGVVGDILTAAVGAIVLVFLLRKLG